MKVFPKWELTVTARKLNKKILLHYKVIIISLIYRISNFSNFYDSNRKSLKLSNVWLLMFLNYIILLIIKWKSFASQLLNHIINYCFNFYFYYVWVHIKFMSLFYLKQNYNSISMINEIWLVFAQHE
jgi:hypothetical protein